MENRKEGNLEEGHNQTFKPFKKRKKKKEDRQEDNKEKEEKGNKEMWKEVRTKRMVDKVKNSKA